MGFELRPEKQKSESQNIGQAVLYAHTDSNQDSSQKFYFMSSTIHLLLLVATAFVSAPIIEKSEEEPITIEIEAEPVQIARGANVQATQGSSPSSANLAAKSAAPVLGGNELPGNDDIVVTKPAGKVSKASQSSSSISRVKSAALAPKSAPVRALPATIADIDDPELDEALIESNKTVHGLDDDFGTEFSKVDSKQKQKMNSIAKQISNDADQLASENDEFLNSLADENQRNTQAILAANKAKRAKDYEGIASAIAAEKSAAAQAAALARAQAIAAGRNGSGYGNGGGLAQGQGQGAGNSGSSMNASQLAGTPNGVRKLEQLRQMPGNPIPQYNELERLNNHQGNVVFYAYVDQNGFLSKFKQTSSTGFPNLDQKTLTALKKWRFYPGQEGWVELPFGWTLKGGAKAYGGTLRARASR